MVTLISVQLSDSKWYSLPHVLLSFQNHTLFNYWSDFSDSLLGFSQPLTCPLFKSLRDLTREKPVAATRMHRCDRLFGHILFCLGYQRRAMAGITCS